MSKSQSLNKKEIIVILNNIRSSENVGSIFRTADATGVSKIILCGYTPAPVDRFGRENKGLTKASLGAEKNIKWEKVENLEKAINNLQKLFSGYSKKCTDIFLPENSSCSPHSGSQGISDSILSNNFLVVGIEQDENAIDYRDLKNSKLVSRALNLVLVFGNEVDGLSKQDLKLCDVIAELPMRGAMVRQSHHPRNLRRGKESLNVSVAVGVVLYSLAD